MIKVFIVEDSPTVRRLLRTTFEESGDFQVVGMAPTADAAVAAIPGAAPDLVTLDVYLAAGSAVSVVRRLLEVQPVRIVLLSDAPRDAAEVFEALDAGALELVRKPTPQDVRTQASLLNALRALSRVPLAGATKARVPSPQAPKSGPRVVTIASSTGGPGALRELLQTLPRTFPLPILVAQHLAEGFEGGFVRWLSSAAKLPLAMVETVAPLTPGKVLFAPSGKDLVVRSEREVAVVAAPDRGFHPSADLLMDSAAAQFPGQAVGIVLSGIGSDGALGAKAIARGGGVVFAQSEATCVVSGMPKAAVESGAVSYVGGPRELGMALCRLVGEPGE